MFAGELSVGLNQIGNSSNKASISKSDAIVIKRPLMSDLSAPRGYDETLAT
jgi:hypothetical protein